MKQMRLAVLLSVVGIAFGGCSTMFNSGSQTMQANASNGKEVKVNISTPAGTYMSKLPATIISTPSTFKSVSIQVADDCYDPSITEVNRGITMSFWANLLNWGSGMVIDALTGAMWKYDSMVSVPVSEKKEKSASCKL